MSQLLPNGSGFGTFDTETTDPSFRLSPSVTYDKSSEEVLPGSVLRYPTAKCERPHVTQC